MTRAWRLVVPALVLTAGCVRVQVEEVSAARYPAVPTDSVRVFVSEGELRDRGYRWETVAVLFAEGSADLTSQRGMLHKLRETAGRYGANGILLSGQREPNLGERWRWGAGADRRQQVVAVRWWQNE